MSLKRCHFSIVLAMVSVLFSACLLRADETYTQPGTGFIFPPTVAEFKKANLTPFKPDFSDIEVDYNNDPYTVHLSTYVYPSVGPLKPHYEQCKADVLKIHPDAKLIEEKPISLTKAGTTFDGYYALYTFRAKMFGDQESDLFSQLIIFRRDNNYVLCRISYLVSDRAAAEKEISNFLEKWDWPAGGKDASRNP